MKRASGVLLHITSLPSPYGVGTLGQAAFDFVDYLHRARQKYWQVLPLTPTGYGELSIDTAWVIDVLKQEAAVLSYKISEGEL